MLQSRAALYRILLSLLAAGLLLVGVLAGAGASPAATVVTMGNEQLSFAGQPATGSIVASQGGYDLINPGFSFSSGQETSGWSGNPDLSFGTSNGQPALSGYVTVLPPSGTLSAAPTRATVTVAVGDQLVVLTGGGSYYLVGVTAASPQSVQFNYQAGTVQPMPTPQPTGTTQKSITVSVGGQTVNFLGALNTGTASITGGGFSFQSGRETPGSSGDISVSADSSGQLILSGDFAVMKQDQDGSYTSDVPSRQTAAISSADNSDDLIFQSTSGDYVFVELDTVAADSVQFSYIVGPAPSSQPTTTVQFPSNVTVGNVQVTFQGQPATGSIAASGGGYDVINPGFNFSSGKETSSGNGTADVAFGTDSSGEPTLAGNVAALPQSGTLSAAPTQATVAVAVGDQMVVLASDGTYYVVAVTAASPQSVRFAYLAGTVQPLPSAQGPSVLINMTDEQILAAVTFGDKGDANKLNDAGTPYTVSTKLGDLHIVTQFAASVQMGINMRKGNTSLSSDQWNQLLGWGGYIAILPQNSGTSLNITVLQNGAAVSPYYVSGDGVYYYKMSTLDTTIPLTIEVANQSGSGSDTATWTWSSLNEPALETQVDSSIPSSSWVTEPNVVSSGTNGSTTQSQNQTPTQTQPTSGSSAGQPQLLNLTEKPAVLNNRTFVPMRELFEALGAKVDWDAEYQIVTATKGDTTIKLKIGDLNAYINGNQEELDAAPFIKDGRTFVPLRFAAEALGENVAYDAATTKVTFGNYYFYINPPEASGQGTAGTSGTGSVSSSNSTGGQGSGSSSNAENNWAKEKAWEAEMNYYSGDMSGISGSGSGDWGY